VAQGVDSEFKLQYYKKKKKRKEKKKKKKKNLVRILKKKKESSYIWWECELVQSLWKSVWRFLRKLKIDVPYDPAKPLLVIYPKGCKSAYNRDHCTSTFTALLFTIAKLIAGKCIGLENFILSKIIQAQKAKYSMSSLICRIQMHNDDNNNNNTYRCKGGSLERRISRRGRGKGEDTGDEAIEGHYIYA
jgi:hypothetical protein